MRFTGTGEGASRKMGATSGGPTGRDRRSSAYTPYNSLSPSNGSTRATANSNRVMPAKGREGDSNQNDINRFMGTAKSRGPNYEATPETTSRIYQRSDTSAISAFRTPSGGTSKRMTTGGGAAQMKAPSNYDNPAVENRMDMSAAKKSPSGGAGGRGALGRTAKRIGGKGGKRGRK